MYPRERHRTTIPGNAPPPMAAEHCYYREVTKAQTPTRTRDGSAAEPRTPAELMREAKATVQFALPAGWNVETSTTVGGRSGGDATLALKRDDSEVLKYRVEIRRMLTRRGALPLIASVDAEPQSNELQLLVVSRYIAPSLQRELRERGIAYADATGNLYMSSTEPLVVLAERGADADPWRGPGRPLASLKGLPAALLVRALVDYRPPYTVPELATASGASLGASYRLVEFLAGEGLLERADRGPITDVRWRQLLERWSQEYGFLETNTTIGFLEPRGIDELITKLRQGSLAERYAITGSLAAQPYAAYAEARLAMVYADDPTRYAEDLGLRAVEAGANVIVATPRSPVVYQRTTNSDGLRIVAPSQAAVDLLTGPGRNPAEGDNLLDWMERNPDEWRHQLDR